MANVKLSNIKSMGFVEEMFERHGVSFDDFIQEIITDIGDELQGILGSSIYNDTTQPTKGRVMRSEKYLVAAELMDRRIKKIIANARAAGEDIDVVREQKEQEKYEKKARDLIDQLIGGPSDFSFGTIETSHFDTTTT